ncbi:MAG TPA: serine hydrolase [Longimicrobiales bacterium]|jgi:CubicO group peptidase (beta-lactamase class C family)
MTAARSRRHVGLAALVPLLTGLLAPVASAQDLEALDAYFSQAREAWGVPGLAVAIVRDGEVVLARGYGVRELGAAEPVDENTLFAIASNSKAFTSAALAMLVDAGELSWDDRVRDHLPWFETYDPWVAADMRVRDVLSHRSGLGTYSGDLLWYGTGYTPEEVVRRAAALDPAGAFRASYGYSNIMFLVGGLLVEEVSGMSWSDFIHQRILNPLGMRRTVTSTDSLPNRDNVARPHGFDWDGEPRPYDWYNWDAMAAAGGIISSASEMARWLELQVGRGELEGQRLFTERQAEEMWTVHNPQVVTASSRESYPSTHFRGYGLGWSLMDYQGRKVMSHGGGYDGMFSRVLIVPEERLGIVLLTNGMTSLQTALGYRILDAFLGGEERDWSGSMLPEWKRGHEREWRRRHDAVARTVEGTRPSLALDAYEATFRSALYGDATVLLEGGGLVLRLLPNPDLVADLVHLQHDTFRVDWRTPLAWFGKGTAQFILDAGGEVIELRLDVPNEDLWFTELELMRVEGR